MNVGIIAESEGFKPPIPGKGIPDFESSAFGHSANLPIANAKVIQKPDSTKRIAGKLTFLFESKLLQAISELFGLTLADT